MRRTAVAVATLAIMLVPAASLQAQTTKMAMRWERGYASVLRSDAVSTSISGQQIQNTRIVPNQVLSISFDIVPTPWADQDGVYPPNLIFLEFRGGSVFSPNAVATATLWVDGVELGSTTGEDTCQPCSSRTWQFAAPGFIDYFIFPNPKIVDFTPVLTGAKGVITLRVQSGYMEFGDAPYTANAPVVVFDAIRSCGSACTEFHGTTLDAVNQTYSVTR